MGWKKWAGCQCSARKSSEKWVGWSFLMTMLKSRVGVPVIDTVMLLVGLGFFLMAIFKLFVNAPLVVKKVPLSIFLSLVSFFALLFMCMLMAVYSFQFKDMFGVPDAKISHIWYLDTRYLYRDTWYLDARYLYFYTWYFDVRYLHPPISIQDTDTNIHWFS